MLVTDESGDDGAYVEEARQALKKYKVPLYVIGRQSLFGYPFAHHRYVDPVTKDVYRPLIRRGPETADLELFQWDGLHDRWDEQPSGFAPYELARLAKDSGGIYFLLPSEEFMRVRQREQAYSITRSRNTCPSTTTAWPTSRGATARTLRRPDPRHRHGGQSTSSTAATSRSSPPSWSRRPPRKGEKADRQAQRPAGRSRSGSSSSRRSATASPRSAGRPTTT